MKYVRQFKQKTIKAETPEEFDQMINAVYFLASAGGKDPEIHYYEGMGLCASIRYFVCEQIAESVKDEYALLGEKYYCPECPYFVLPQDRRVKKTVCSKGNRTYTDSEACDIFYEMLKGGLIDEKRD